MQRKKNATPIHPHARQGGTFWNCMFASFLCYWFSLIFIRYMGRNYFSEARRIRPGLQPGEGWLHSIRIATRASKRTLSIGVSNQVKISKIKWRKVFTADWISEFSFDRPRCWLVCRSARPYLSEVGEVATLEPTLRANARLDPPNHQGCVACESFSNFLPP